MSKRNKTFQRAYNANARDIAEYFLRKGEQDGELISNLKLQKLVYYAQGIHLAMNGSLIFNEKIVAWTYGPVIPELYHLYKCYEANGIPPTKDYNPQISDPKLIDFLDEIYTAFGQFSAPGLMNLAHSDKCWIDVFNDSPQGEITPSSMARDLKKYLKSDKD